MIFARPHSSKNNVGQAAIELAVFGAILIFVLGSIVRAALNNSFTQNENLKAMRYALLRSWESSLQLSTSRNNASIIYIEDRLSADFGKYGSLERTPFIGQGAGTFSNLLMYPLDFEDLYRSLPTMDIFVNGVHIPLTTAGVRIGMNLVPPMRIQGQLYDRWYPTNEVPDPAGNGTYHYDGWNFKCVEGNWKRNPSASKADVPGYFGCPLFYSIVANGTPSFCTTKCDGPLSINEQFDLNRNGIFTDDPQPGTKLAVPREKFGWQWTAVNGLVSNVKIDTDAGNYPSYDIDKDLKEETIYAVNVGEPAADVDKAARALGVITTVRALDYQEGDVDISGDTPISQGKYGLMTDTAVYTMPRDQGGPGKDIFEIKEGNLVIPGSNNVVRSVSRKDQVDIIERRIRLKNDTVMNYATRQQHFCDPVTRQPVNWNASVPDPSFKGEDNPVEVCGDCLDPNNLWKTCLDPDSKIMYVRSRLPNTNGHKWLTGTSGALGKWGELQVR